MNRSRIILIGTIGVCVLALAVVILSASQAIGNVNNGTLKLTLAPSDAKITVDGKAAKLGDANDLSLKAGNHTLAFSRGGFASKSVSVTIVARETTTKIVALSTSSPAGVDYLKKNPKEAAIVDGLGSQEMEKHAKAITENAPLIQLLPYHGSGFDIDVGVSQKYKDDAHVAAIYVTTDTQQGRNAALGWIRAQGYDPAGYEIIYQTNASAQ